MLNDPSTKDTSIKRTSLLVPIVSVIEVFHCITIIWCNYCILSFFSILYMLDNVTIVVSDPLSNNNKSATVYGSVNESNVILQQKHIKLVLEIAIEWNLHIKDTSGVGIRHIVLYKEVGLSLEVQNVL